jgi:hypothetical protein
MIKKIKETVSKKKFEDFVENNRNKRIKEYKFYIKNAKINALIYGNRKIINFVKSCEKYLNERGHLTENQIAALYNIENFDPELYIGWYDYGDYGDYDDGFEYCGYGEPYYDYIPNY